MEFTSSNERNRIKSTLEQIRTAIAQLKEWNEGVNSADDYYMSSDGMQKLAANCMLIEAIGEGIKKVDKISKGDLLVERPEIPWLDVMGIRDHIAHGYFDIDGDIIFTTIKFVTPFLEEIIKHAIPKAACFTLIIWVIWIIGSPIHCHLLSGM
ncbi:MAG: DUF86 domain-containing protein [Prevotella sp.]|nr:DUF86 domain-containing protein [Prevotella sp.]